MSDGDFHVYLENGEPKIGIRFIGNKIQEIQGELNNSKIPYKYFNLVKKHINKNNLELKPLANEEIKKAEATKQKIEKIKQDLAEAIQKNDATKIYEYFGIEVEKLSNTNILDKIYKFFGLKVKNDDKKEKLILSKYVQPDEDITYEDLGIDENKLFKNVIKIKGHASFNNSNLTDLANLESIGLSADFSNSQNLKLGKLKSIGSADFRGSILIDLGNLRTISAYADFRDSEITNLNNLESIGDSVFLKNSKLNPSDFKNIKVGGEIIE